MPVKFLSHELGTVLFFEMRTLKKVYIKLFGSVALWRIVRTRWGGNIAFGKTALGSVFIRPMLINTMI